MIPDINYTVLSINSIMVHTKRVWSHKKLLLRDCEGSQVSSFDFSTLYQ